MVSISVVIITFNEERNLARCLDSVKDIADEIVIVDSHSTDNTTEIARRYNAKVIEQAFMGYREQKNFANNQAAHDWILSLDADEVVTPMLKKNILEVKKGPWHDVYQMPRLTNYCGHWIKHSGWYPDKKLRLFNRTMGEWKGGKIHEYWALHDTKQKTGTLQENLLHYSYYSISDHIRVIDKFTEISAMEAALNGKDSSLIKIWLGPKWNFCTSYIIRLGILDGYYGYIVCKLSSYAAFIKYVKIRHYAELKRKGQL